MHMLLITLYLLACLPCRVSECVSVEEWLQRRRQETLCRSGLPMPWKWNRVRCRRLQFTGSAPGDEKASYSFPIN